MADEKISQLSDAGAPQSSDQFVIARAGSSLSILWSALSAAAGGAVSSVFGRTGAVTAQTGDYTAAQVGALPSTETLDQIATANATAASVAMNSHKLTGLAAGSGNGDSLRYEQLISLYLLLTGGTMSGAIAMGSNKITGLTNGSAASDAAAFGQIPTALPPNGTAGGDLSGTYPNPAVKAITETSGPTDLTIGTITDGQFLKRTGSTLVSGAVMSNPLTTKGDIIIEDASPAPARLPIGSAAQVLNVASGLPAWATPPGFEIGYDQITASVNITGTSAGSPTTIITCASHTFDGAPVLMEFFTPFVITPTNVTATSDAVGILLVESATALAEIAFIREGIASPSTNGYFPICAKFRFTPSAGAHSYVIAAYTGATTGTPSIGAAAGTSGADTPAFVRFTKV